MTALKEKPLLALAALAFCVYSALSLTKHWHFQSNAYDLGNFDQMAWNYSRLRAPASTQLGLDNGLGDHFSPVLALCAPLFWVFPRVEILLIVQAALVALSFVPLFSYCERRAGRYTAYCLTAAFAIFWGTQRTIWSDFHPDVFAVPLIALAIYFIDVEKWGRACASILPLLAVKEELALLVAFFGIYLAWNGKLRLGAALLAGGLLFFALAVLVVIPHFAGAHRPEWIFTDLGPNPVAALKASLANPLLPLRLMFSAGAKLRAYLLLLGPFLFLPLLSKQFLLLLPLLAAKELTNNPNMWSFSTHYSAFICPILATAAADGLANLADLLPPRFSVAKLLPYAPVSILAVNLLILHDSPWRGAESPDFWRYGATEKTGAEALALIPPDVSVGTQTSIAPHLTHRRAIHALDIDHSCESISPDFFVASRDLSSYPLPFSDVAACLNEKVRRGYKKIFERDGWVVLKR